MCEIVCVKKNNSAFFGFVAILIFLRRTERGGGGFPVIVTLSGELRVAH